MDGLRHDLRHAVARSTRRHQGHRFAAFLTLALGLGVTAALVSVVDGVLCAHSPIPSPNSWCASPNSTEARSARSATT